jgi:RNA polymerase sigma-70 factor (ECF subfamily)
LDDEQARELIRHVARRDEDAFSRLWRGLERPVGAYLRTMLDRAHERDEVLSEAFEIVWHSAARFDFRSRVETWVIGIARNRALMKLRARKDHEPLQDWDDEPLAADDPIVGELDRQQTRERVRRCLARLDALHREAIHLLFFHEYPVRQIAELTHVPEGTVKSRVFKAKAAIKACLRLHPGGADTAGAE